MKEIHISFGKNIKDAQEAPAPMTLHDIFNLITHDGDLERKTKMVRKIYQVSKDHYRNMKTSLPYVSCSHFNGKTRKFDHFEKASGWILDLDGKSKADYELFEKCLSDPRVVLSYTSPSGMGKKLLFLFDSPVEDPQLYSDAYRAFTHSWALQYGLFNHIDQKNCDVSRVSFLCADLFARFNHDYIAIHPEEFIQIRQKEAADIPENQVIPAGVYTQILSRLGTKAKPNINKWQPLEAIEVIIPLLQEKLRQETIEIHQIEYIAHGAKLHLMHQHNRGEIIIYYGKRGYSVVTSPKKGIHPQLNEAAKHIAEMHLYQMI
jgi:hypothetical protein